jgi:hypothetical protein
MFAWRRGTIRSALEKFTPLMTVVGTALGSDLALAGAYERLQPMSIDVAVMEGAARDHRVLMATLDAGWSDVGSWSALLAGLAGPAGRSGSNGKPAAGRVVQTGERIDVGEDDLVIRPVEGRLEVDAPGQGTILADGVWAHLIGARHLGPQVRALLERVQRGEVGS